MTIKKATQNFLMLHFREPFVLSACKRAVEEATNRKYVSDSTITSTLRYLRNIENWDIRCLSYRGNTVYKFVNRN